MALTSSTLKIWRHEYYKDVNTVIFVGIGTLLFYAINIDPVNLFACTSFLILTTLKLYCIDELYQFEMNEYRLLFKKKIEPI
jgi:hypothetical protein